MFRMKNLKEITVMRPVPEDFNFNGPVPFNLKISDNIIEANILAIDESEAENIFNNWLQSLKETDD